MSASANGNDQAAERPGERSESGPERGPDRWNYSRAAVADAIAHGEFSTFIHRFTKEELARPTAAGFSIVADAALSRDGHALDALRARGVDFDIFAAVAWGIRERVDELLDADPSLLHAERWCGTPLDWALVYDRLELAERLLERGYSGPVRVHGGSDDAIRWAVHHGADLDGGALHQETRHGRPSGVAVLLELGADPNHGDLAGDTPLHVLARRGLGREIARLLLDAGANPDLPNRTGDTPRQLAASARRSTLHEFFERLDGTVGG